MPDTDWRAVATDLAKELNAAALKLKACAELHGNDAWAVEGMLEPYLRAIARFHLEDSKS